MKYVNNVNVKRIKYNIDLLLCFEGKLKIEPKKKTMPTVVCHALMRCQELSASTSDQVTKKLVPPQTASVIELPPELPPKTKRSRMCNLYMYGKHCKVLSYFIQWFFGCLSVCNVMWCFRNFKIFKKKNLIKHDIQQNILYTGLFLPTCYIYPFTLANTFAPSWIRPKKVVLKTDNFRHWNLLSLKFAHCQWGQKGRKFIGTNISLHTVNYKY